MENNNVVKVSELKQGDILLFSHTDDWDSKLIALVTNSAVSHSAMSYYDYTNIVEETPPSAQVNPIEERKVGRVITVMRLNPDNLDMTKVLKIAEQYVEEKEPYSKINLVFIMIYILIKKIPIPVFLQRLLLPLLQHVIADMINYLNDIFFKGTHPMVCSQFVYKCYEDAGDEYKLIVNDFEEGKSLLSQIQDYIRENKASLEDKLVNDINMIKTDRNALLTEEENLLKNIYFEFENHIKLNKMETTCAFDEEFVVAVHEFCTILQYLNNQNNNKDAVINNSDVLESAAIKELEDVEEYFVTPGDFMTKCTNLTNIGILGD